LPEPEKIFSRKHLILLKLYHKSPEHFCYADSIVYSKRKRRVTKIMPIDTEYKEFIHDATTLRKKEYITDDDYKKMVVEALSVFVFQKIYYNLNSYTCKHFRRYFDELSRSPF
jgi:hypothetical protein